jgi:hypothetical protein
MAESFSLHKSGVISAPVKARSLADGETPGTLDFLREVPWYIYAALLATTSISVGIVWDISWHMSIGRDGLFSPPHLAIYLGGVLAGLGGAYQMFRYTFFVDKTNRPNTVWFWGFRAPLASLICIWGALAMLTSAPFDDWWHNAYGLDVKILSPPHAILLLGMITIQIGALIQVLSFQNSLAQRAKQGDQLAQKGLLSVRLMYAFTIGMLLVIVDVAFSTQFLWINDANSTRYYITAGIIFPLFLLAVARSSGLRWGATLAAICYTVLLLLLLWILPLFPAKPLLGPVNNAITHFVPFRFPMLLIVPALLVDLVYAKMADRKVWATALGCGVAFMAVLIPVQRYFADFYFSPYADNWFFAAKTAGVGYFSNTSWQYLYTFYPWNDQSATEMVIGIGWAFFAAVLSSLVGIWWGNWMRKVQR